MCDAIHLTRRDVLVSAAAAGAGLMLGPSAARAAMPDAQATDAAGAASALPLADALPGVAATLPAGPGQPPIIARRAWAGAGHRPTHAPEYGTVELAVVHHTLNLDGYGPADVPALLRAIYAFHVHTRGWFDIGYNFLIDRFGRIWEGREGGIAEPVIGAQAGDFNQISTGVALIGTFADALPPAPAMTALARLIAWKLSLHGVPAIGEITTRAPASDIGWTDFHAGELVRFPRIAGHRQVDATDCPGNPVFADLAALRRRVAGLAGRPGQLTLSVTSGSLAGADVVSLSGRLARTAGGMPITDAPVVLGVPGQTGALAHATTDGDGRFTVGLSPRLRRGAELVVQAVHASRPAVVSPAQLLPGVAGLTT